MKRKRGASQFVKFNKRLPIDDTKMVKKERLDITQNNRAVNAVSETATFMLQ